MKHFLVIATLLLSGSAFAQTEVSVYGSDKSQREGITYFLPKNKLTVTVEATKTSYVPGQYCKYAEQFLRLTDIAPEPKVTWKLDKVTTQCDAIPDPSKSFYIKVVEKSSAPKVQLTEDGILCAVNDQVTLESQPAPTPVAPVKKKILKPQDFFTEEIIQASSSLTTAKLIAAEIMQIRDKRNELTRGELDNMPSDGVGMQLMLNQLNEQEEALLSLFQGTTETESHTFTFQLIPTEPVQEQVLFRLSSKLGVVAADDLSGAPVYYSLESQHTVADKKPATPEEIKRADKLAKDNAKRAMKGEPFLQEGIVYNVPERCTFRIYTPKKTLFTDDFKFGQLGNTEVLLNDLFNKKSTLHVTFSPQDGSILKVRND